MLHHTRRDVAWVGAILCAAFAWGSPDARAMDSRPSVSEADRAPKPRVTSEDRTHAKAAAFLLGVCTIAGVVVMLRKVREAARIEEAEAILESEWKDL